MAIKGGFFLCLIVLVNMVASSKAAVTPSSNVTDYVNRKSFPAKFIFGTATSAYQIEGAANEGGRRPSIWDTFTHTYPEKIRDGSNADVAIDSYNRYKEDVGIMKETGLDAYRFSISWPRVIPHGKLSKGVNKEGINYYNNLINELLANGLQPFVTLFHWDLPQTLEDEYGGFMSPRIVDDFQDYAELCYKAFGDRVKHWITLNEPWGYSIKGYVTGVFAPGRCSAWQNLNCTGGDSGTEPYLVSHHQLLAHATAVKVYKQKYQAVQKGKIGITLVSHWFVPYSPAQQDNNAAKIALDFMLGWFMDPLTYGQYPHTMRDLVGNRLPKFTKEQSMMLKGSYDFVGINYYTANYAKYVPHSNVINPSYTTDFRADLSTERDGVNIGPPSGSDWLYVYPRGIRYLLNHTKTFYNNPIIYITENGVSEINNISLSLKDALNDKKRVDYYHLHLLQLHKAIFKDRVKVRGYFAWSLLDNFEWDVGYTVRFGINYIDYKNGLKRYPKLSAAWFKNFLKK